MLRRTGRLSEANAVADQLMAAAELMPFALPLAVAEKTLALLDLGQLNEAGQWWLRLDEMTAGKTRRAGLESCRPGSGPARRGDRARPRVSVADIRAAGTIGPPRRSARTVHLSVGVPGRSGPSGLWP